MLFFLNSISFSLLNRLKIVRKIKNKMNPKANKNSCIVHIDKLCGLCLTG